jgi:hypothetical protein
MRKRLKFTFTIVTDTDQKSVAMVYDYMHMLETVLKEVSHLLPAYTVDMKEEVEKE